MEYHELALGDRVLYDDGSLIELVIVAFSPSKSHFLGTEQEFATNAQVLAGPNVNVYRGQSAGPRWRRVDRIVEVLEPQAVKVRLS
jgi:hypothetical protein